jgi:hypothetical protein
MKRYRGLFTVLLFCCAGQIPAGQEQSLKAEIKLTRTVVKNDETFFVATVVRNTGSTVQSLIVWDCSYPDQWTTDNPAARINDVACQQNTRGEIQLKPGASYIRSVSLHIHVAFGQVTQDKVAFRMGYGKMPYFRAQDVVPKVPLLWSNAVTVAVTR